LTIFCDFSKFSAQYLPQLRSERNVLRIQGNSYEAMSCTALTTFRFHYTSALLGFPVNNFESNVETRTRDSRCFHCNRDIDFEN